MGSFSLRHWARNLKYYFLQMSRCWEPPKYGPKGLENKWINSIYETHDHICGCNNTIHHLIEVINRQNSTTPLTTKEIQQIKCHITGETTGEQEEDKHTEDALEDLAKLFEEDGDFGDPAEQG